MCKRLALMGPETMTDVVCFDVQQWYVDINAVKLTRIVWKDIGTISRHAARGHDIAMSKSLAIFFDLSNNSENLFRHCKIRTSY